LAKNISLLNVKNIYSSPFFPAIGWGFFILILSLIPPGQSQKIPLFKIPHLDKLIHFVFYFIFCWLLINGMRAKLQRINATVFTSSLLIAIAYGFFIEILQYFTSWRSFEWWDVLANSTGALTAIILSKWVSS